MNKKQSKWVFQNSPFEILAEAFRRLYPDVEYMAFIDSNIGEGENGEKVYGLTNFDEDSGAITIFVDSNLSIENAVEIFAHELAHAVVGIEHDHDEVWEGAFDELFKEYNKIGGELFYDDSEMTEDDDA